MAYAGKVGETRPTIARNGRSRPVGAIATGVAIGLLVGAGVALLLAPQTGLDTRGDIRRRWRRTRLRGHDAWEDLRLELRRARRKLKRARLRAQLAVEDREPIES